MCFLNECALPYYYSVFGLSVKSDFEIHQLVSTKQTNTDVFIRLGSVSDSGLINPITAKPCTQQITGQAWLAIPGVAKYLVKAPNIIIVDPDVNASSNEVSLYLLGTCLAVIAHQKNHSVIHGNVIKIGQQAIILAGDSGAGKSTLAAAFHQKGYDLISDDLGVITSDFFVQPGYPSMKISPATATLLDIATNDLQWVKRDREKYVLPLKSGFYNKPMLVAGIYTLNLYEEHELKIEPLTGASKLVALRKNTYRKGMLKGLGLKVNQLRLLSELANNIFIENLYRPKAGYDITEYISFIEQDLRAKSFKV